MPNSPALWAAAVLLWVLDASINVSMEPFRAFVGDQMPPRQRAKGYAMQSFFIGLGAVVASALPWLLTRAGVASTAAPGVVPDAVRYAFYLGGAVLFGAVGWTVLRTRELPPEELVATDTAPRRPAIPLDPLAAKKSGAAWLGAAALLMIAVERFGLERELYLLAGGIGAYGVTLWLLSRGVGRGMFATIMADLHDMPPVMRKLAVVQFFSWFALFAMWIYTTAAVASVHFGSSDPASPEYNAGANWVGILFAGYNGFAMLAAIVIPRMGALLGIQRAHFVNLLLGAAGLLSIQYIRDPDWLLLSMAGVGFAWASILSLPYALLADSLPAEKMGIYMGIFNFFIVIPQLVAATALRFLLKTFFGGAPIHALTLGAVSLAVAALAVLFVQVAQTGNRNAEIGSAA
jgi:maltose/moltooligosaccharide transporter